VYAGMSGGADGGAWQVEAELEKLATVEIDADGATQLVTARYLIICRIEPQLQESC
jgi:hypothetical protein